MTLNLMIVGPWGVWQSTDQRVTDLADGSILDDSSHKNVGIICPDGAALLTYAGFGWVNTPRGRVVISDWVRELLRGETRTVDQSLILLTDEATAALAPFCVKYNVRHMFSVGVSFKNGGTWAVQIRNFAPDRPWSDPVLPKFDRHAFEFTGEGEGFMFGPPGSVSDADIAKLRRCARRKPSRNEDYRRLLAAINLRASKSQYSSGRISPQCVTAFMPRDGTPLEYGPEGTQGMNLGHPPMLLLGIDMTSTQRALSEAIATEAEPQLDWSDATTPQNRLGS